MSRIKISITDEQEVQDICHIATQICCLRKGSLAYKSRRKELQLPRTIVSNIARIEKCIHYNVIAKVLKRHRCSIYHYESNHRDNYEGWKEYRILFNRIYNAYNDIKGGKKKFMQEQDIKSFLKSKGIVESLEPSVFIIITCDTIKAIIKTDYKNFSDTLELIRLALTNDNYDYRLEVKL